MKHNTRLTLTISLTLMACAGPRPSPPPPEPPISAERVIAYNTARTDVEQAARRVKASLLERARVEAQASLDPTRCSALDRLGARVDLNWLALAGAYGALARTASGTQLGVRARRGEERALVQRRLDQAHHLEWRSQCALAPAFEPPEPVGRGKPVALGRGIEAIGQTTFWVSDVDLLSNRAGLRVARTLSKTLRDDADVMVLLAADGLSPEAADLASVVINRGRKGEGRAPLVDAARLPGWRRLRGVVVVDGEAPLRETPLLRGLARLHANRLPIDGCSPQPGGGWGWSDVGGQLGGGRPGSLRALPGGRYRLTAVHDRMGLIANGGNSVPYAPLELYLMGLEQPEAVPVSVFVKAPSEASGETIRGEGVCHLDGPALVRRFGRRPLDLDPWRVALVVVSKAPLTPRRQRAIRQQWAGFTAPSADDDIDSLNFFEATGGRGRLSPIPLVRRRP